MSLSLAMESTVPSSRMECALTAITKTSKASAQRGNAGLPWSPSYNHKNNAGMSSQHTSSSTNLHSGAPASSKSSSELTIQERVFLVEALKQNFLFRGFSNSVLESIVRHMKYRTYPQNGTPVVMQGEEGDNMYIVDHGKLDVYVGTGGTSRKILQYSRGASFGELALMYDCPRSTTVKTATPFVSVYALDKSNFKTTVSRMRERQRHMLLFHEIPLLKDNLNRAQLVELCSRAVLRRHDGGMPSADGKAAYAPIFAKGLCEARGTNHTHIRRASLTTRLNQAAQPRALAGAPLYIIQVGRVLECESAEDAEQGRGHMLHAGDVIGIDAFLEGKPLAYNYYTRETTLLLQLKDDENDNNGARKKNAALPMAWASAPSSNGKGDGSSTSSGALSPGTLRALLREPLRMYGRMCALRQSCAGNLQFSWLSRDMLNRLAKDHMIEITLPEGTVLARRGTIADRLTIVVSGSVSTSRGSMDDDDDDGGGGGEGSTMMKREPQEATTQEVLAGANQGRRFGTGVLVATVGCSLVTHLPEMGDVVTTSTCKAFQVAPGIATAPTPVAATPKVGGTTKRASTLGSSRRPAEKLAAFAQVCSELHRKGAAHALAQALDAMGGISLGAKEVERVAQDFRALPFEPGDTLVREGAPGEKFFLLAYGEVEISVRTMPTESINSTGQVVGVSRNLQQEASSKENPRRATPATGVLMKSALGAIANVPRASNARRLTRCSTEDTGIVSRRATRVSQTLTRLKGGNGAYFGERALVEKKPRAATVRALTHGMCYSLSRDAFERHFGKLRDLMRAAAKREDLAQKERNISTDNLDVVRTIGIGTFARVRLVKDSLTGNVYALKTMDRRRITKYRHQHRVQNERAILAACSHPFITRLVKTFKDASDVHMLLEAHLGGMIFRFLDELHEQTFDEASARFYAGCIISALSYLHARGVVYRNIRPGNILLGADGYARLIDFSFAKTIGFDDRTFSVVGAPDYAAPEMILRKGHAFGVDCWGLGCMIFQMLTNTSAFAPRRSGPAYESQVYRNVLDGSRAAMGRHLSVQARGIVDALLVVDENKRLGHVSGIQDVKEHGWFWRISWADLEARRLPPPATVIPGESNFDFFEDDNLDWRPGCDSGGKTVVTAAARADDDVECSWDSEF
ncbi:cGMP-dependent protein kinase [Pseudoscourfieldia marina]